jgi:hypothetical protein
MSIENDPDFWKQISGWLWAVLALPVAALWKKVENSMPKDEFSRYATEVKEAIKEHASDDEKNFERHRQMFIDLFEKIEKQGNGIERIETTLTFLRERK